MKVVFAIAALAAMFCGEAAASQSPGIAELNARLKADLRCARDLIYTEARGEPEYGQALIVWVAQERLRLGWAKTFCGVTHQVTRTHTGLVSQFSGVIHHKVTKPDNDPELMRLTSVAARVILGYWYPKIKDRHAIAYRRVEHSHVSSNPWFATLRPVGKTGHHTFYCLPDKKQAKTKLAHR